MLGTMVGALIISVVANGLRILSVPQEWQIVVTGAIIILAVYLTSCVAGASPRGGFHHARIVSRAKTKKRADRPIKPTSQSTTYNSLGGHMLNRRLTLALLGATVMLASSGFAVAQDKPYIALISKGFQHQFWQAVKLGSDKAAAEFNVNATFEGPDGEGAVDRQLDMIATALSKKPAAISIAAIDSQATIPLLQQAKDAGIIVLAFDSGVQSDIPISTGVDRQPRVGGPRCRQDWPR